MNATSRRQKRKEELRRVILDAAREIFVHEGYEKFSMRKLAEKIEYSPGRVYLYFKNKEELFECLVAERFARLLKTFTTLRTGQERRNDGEEPKECPRTCPGHRARNTNSYCFVYFRGAHVGQA